MDAAKNCIDGAKNTGLLKGDKWQPVKPSYVPITTSDQLVLHRFPDTIKPCVKCPSTAKEVKKLQAQNVHVLCMDDTLETTTPTGGFISESSVGGPMPFGGVSFRVPLDSSVWVYAHTVVAELIQKRVEKNPDKLFSVLPCQTCKVDNFNDIGVQGLWDSNYVKELNGKLETVGLHALCHPNNSPVSVDVLESIAQCVHPDIEWYPCQQLPNLQAAAEVPDLPDSVDQDIDAALLLLSVLISDSETSLNDCFEAALYQYIVAHTTSFAFHIPNMMLTNHCRIAHIFLMAERAYNRMPNGPWVYSKGNAAQKIFFCARKAIEIVEAAEIDCPYSRESLNPVHSSSDLACTIITVGTTVSSCVPEDQMALLFLNNPSGEKKTW